VGWQYDFRMDDASLVGVVVGHAVPLVYQLLAAPIGGSSYGRLALAAPDDLNGTMKNCYAVLPPFGVLTAVG
jgi:hypothetical protein